MNFMDALLFMDMNDQELIDLFKTPKQKLPEVIENSNLPTLLAPFKQYFRQVGLNSKYCTEDYFNTARSKYKNNEFSVFHLNKRSLNKHHVELTTCTYISLLQIDFDCICLPEIDTFNIDFYKHIFPNHIFHFDLPNSSNIGGVAIYIKKGHKVTDKSEYKIRSSNNAKVENLWYEITNCSKCYIVGTIYRHPNHNIKDFTETG